MERDVIIAGLQSDFVRKIRNGLRGKDGGILAMTDAYDGMQVVERLRRVTHSELERGGGRDHVLESLDRLSLLRAGLFLFLSELVGARTKRSLFRGRGSFPSFGLCA
jgi:hypothetical protein